MSQVNWLATLLVPPGADWWLMRKLLARRPPDPPRNPAMFGLAYEVITFPARDGTRLMGWWIPAPSPARGTVLILHGQAGSMDGDLHYAPHLVQRGFNVLMFDFRAHGRSDGDLVTFGYWEVCDVRGALDWLSARGISRVGVWGCSMGGGVALTTAAHDPRIAALVLDCPFAQLPHVIAGALRERHVPALLADAWARRALWLADRRLHVALRVAEPLRWAPRVRVPTFVLHAGRDRFIPPADREALFGALGAPVKEHWVVPQADHREIEHVAPEAYFSRIPAWFETHLPTT